MGQRGACAQERPFDVHGDFSLTCVPVSVTARLATPPCRSGNFEVDGSAPPQDFEKQPSNAGNYGSEWE